MAASLVVMVGRGSPAWSEGPRVAGRAAELRDRLLALGDVDVEAFGKVLTELRRLRAEPSGREALDAALLGASEVPLQIAQAGAEVARLAADAARAGKRPMRPDATTAALLAGAATRAASLLVEGNLAALREGRHRERVEQLIDDARDARRTARDAVDTASATVG
jgi:formiminotetrahydrofolate cyclodeaminase